MAERSIRTHIVFTVVLVTLLLLFALLLVRLTDVWLLAFGGALMAVALHGAGAWIAERVPLSTSVAVGIVCTLTFALAGLGIWSLGPAFVDGLAQLREQLPAALEQLRDFVASRPALSGLVDEAAERASEMSPVSGLLGRVGDLFSKAFGVLSALSGALVGIFVICIVAIYGALRPGAYTAALLAVLPNERKGRAREVLGELAHALRWWLIGRASSMLVVGLLTWIGLTLLGVPSAGTLAALAALLSFVPNIGPIVSAVPAVLVGLGQSPTTALYVVGLYVLVQTVESYVVTPLIQQRVVALPPASVIVVQLAFGSALGLLGLLFATPIAVVVMVLVQMLWIEDTLGQRTELPRD